MRNVGHYLPDSSWIDGLQLPIISVPAHGTSTLLQPFDHFPADDGATTMPPLDPSFFVHNLLANYS